VAGQNQRITRHFTLTSCSWLDLFEIFFDIITRNAIRRGTFTRLSQASRIAVNLAVGDER
jgi:hypothetical protein